MKHNPLPVPVLRHVERSAVPYHIMKGRVTDAAQLALERKGHVDFPREGSLRFHPMPPCILADGFIIKTEIPFAIEG